MLTKEGVIAALLALSAEDLVEIHNHTEALLSISKIPVSISEDWLLAGILEEVKARGLSFTIPEFFTIKTFNAYAGYQRRSEIIRTALQGHIFKSMHRVDFYALGRLCALLLAEYLEQRFDLSLDVMLRHVDEIPLALESAFPGYINAGLLYLLLKPQHAWQE